MRTALLTLGLLTCLASTAQAARRDRTPKATRSDAGWNTQRSEGLRIVTRPLGKRPLLMTPASAQRSALEAARWAISLTEWDVTATGANTLELRAKVKPGLFRSGTPYHIRASVATPIRVTVQRAAGQEQVTFLLPTL